MAQAPLTTSDFRGATEPSTTKKQHPTVLTWTSHALGVVVDRHDPPGMSIERNRSVASLHTDLSSRFRPAKDHLVSAPRPAKMQRSILVNVPRSNAIRSTSIG